MKQETVMEKRLKRRIVHAGRILIGTLAGLFLLLLAVAFATESSTSFDESLRPPTIALPGWVQDETIGLATPVGLAPDSNSCPGAGALWRNAAADSSIKIWNYPCHSQVASRVGAFCRDDRPSGALNLPSVLPGAADVGYAYTSDQYEFAYRCWVSSDRGVLTLEAVCHSNQSYQCIEYVDRAAENAHQTVGGSVLPFAALSAVVARQATDLVFTLPFTAWLLAVAPGAAINFLMTLPRRLPSHPSVAPLGPSIRRFRLKWWLFSILSSVRRVIPLVVSVCFVVWLLTSQQLSSGLLVVSLVFLTLYVAVRLLEEKARPFWVTRKPRTRPQRKGAEWIAFGVGVLCQVIAVLLLAALSLIVGSYALVSWFGGPYSDRVGVVSDSLSARGGFVNSVLLDFLSFGGFSTWSSGAISVLLAAFAFATVSLRRIATVLQQADFAPDSQGGPRVLYLRGFDADYGRIRSASVGRRSLLERFSPWRSRTLAEVVARHSDVLGPLVAAADPDNFRRVNRVALKTVAYEQKKWRKEIRSEAEDALAVLVHATPRRVNDGLAWELNLLAGIGHKRIILVLSDALTRNETRRRWNQFCAAAEEYHAFRGVQEVGMGGAVQFVTWDPFCQGWRGFSSSRKTEWSYLAGMLELKHRFEHVWSRGAASGHRGAIMIEAGVEAEKRSSDSPSQL